MKMEDCCCKSLPGGWCWNRAVLALFYFYFSEWKGKGMRRDIQQTHSSPQDLGKWRKERERRAQREGERGERSTRAADGMTKRRDGTSHGSEPQC